MIQNKITLEKAAYQDFMRIFSEGRYYNDQTLGQAFYTHFRLHKSADKCSLLDLCSKDGQEAVAAIRERFTFK